MHPANEEKLPNLVHYLVQSVSNPFLFFFGCVDLMRRSLGNHPFTGGKPLLMGRELDPLRQ